MKRILLYTTCLVGVLRSFGQEAEVIENPDRFNLGGRVGFNFKASFRNHSQSNPGSTVGGINHGYDDGYVNVDRTGNSGGRTWNWGYQDAAQVSGGAIEFHSDQRSTVPLELEAGEDEPQLGLELGYQRIFGTFFFSGRWGFEGAVSYTDIDLSEERTDGGFVTHVTDSYGLNGVVPPTAPYNGTFNGPGPLLRDRPTRTTQAEGATTTSRQELSGYAVGFRVGPFFEWDLAKRLVLTLSAGLAFAGTGVDYDFAETTTLQGGQQTIARGNSHKNDLLYGNYVMAAFRYEFTRHWGLYAGGQFQHLNDLEQTVAGRTARLEQGATYFGVAGVSFRF